MSKRKLNRRQTWRVNKIHAERVKRADKSGEQAEQALAGGELGPEQNGLVVAHYGTLVEVEAQGLRQRCHMRANLEGLVTGDNVVWCAGQPTGVIVAQLPRDSELKRPDSHGRLKPVAANIEQIIIVLAPLPEPHANLVDRYLVAAEAVGITPLLLLNKTDLLDDSNRSALEELLAPYPTLGYQVLRASVTGSEGLNQLRDALRDKISIFVGQSGVGKSSLVNILLPGTNARIGALSQARGKGIHTTTTAEMFHLDGGGSLIDSPGIREFGLWHMEREQVEAGFREFHPCLGYCRFRDCKHETEPGCALLAAAEEGKILPRRLASYRHIVASLLPGEHA
jgi:ribosome biogenesis GTPase